MIILYFIVVGLAAGWIADYVLRRGATHSQLFIAGLIGSFIGGTLFSLLAGDGFRIRPSGLIGSVIGAIAVFAVWKPRRAGHA